METYKMKKIFAFALLITLFSCSSSDDNNENSSNQVLNPPEWIQGSWANSLGGNLRFTTDDFCIGLSTTEICNKDNYTNAVNSNLGTVTETITESLYKVIANITSISTTYEFQKVSDTEFLFASSLTSSTYTKQ